MRIRYSGRPIPSSVTAACVDSAGGHVLKRHGMTGMWVACVALAVFGSGAARAGMQLITEQEAKLPPPKGAVAADRRGILRGPKIDFISPAEPVRSPAHLQLKFESFGRGQ